MSSKNESTNAFNAIVADCGEALARIGNLLASEKAGQALLARLGWRVGALPAPLLALGSHLRDLKPLLTEALAHPDSPDPWVSLAKAVVEIIDEIRDLKNQSFGSEFDAAGFGGQVAEQLLHWAAIEQLDRRHPGLLAIFRALGIVRAIEHPAADGRTRYSEDRLVCPDFAATFTSPSTLMRAAWAWGDPAFDGSGLLDEVIAVFRALGVPAGFVAVPPSTRELAEVAPGAVRWHVLARLLSTALGEAGLRVFNLREGTEPAIAIVPYVEGSLAQTIQFGDGLEFAIKGAASASEGRALLITPSAIKLVNDLFGTASATAAGEISATLQRRLTERAETAIGPALVKSAGWSIRAAARASEGADSEVVLEAAFTDASIGLSVAEDGFLSSLFGGKQATIPVPLLLGISSRQGVYLGTAGLSQEIETSLRLGPITVRRISLKLAGADRGVNASVTTALSANIGPVGLAVEGLGASLNIRFPDSGGNLGPVDLHADFVPPTGVGLSIDASVVLGGGFLRFDPQKKEYSGVLQLEIAEKISVKALGLLSTQMPDGSDGYSLVVIIFAEGFAPIQLGFGFTLTGIGGLIAINRTFDEDVLRAGIKNHTLDSVMFPKDPIRNAPQILSTLNKVFPAAKGHHLFGPMVQISWGTPPLITLNLAVVMEVGARLRLLVLGQVSAILPKRENDLVRLQMDAIGIVDFDQGTASLDASLYDSRLLKKFVLTGDMAMRLKWESSPNFALSVGGLHPAFNPPPKFPKLERITINLCSGDNPRFRCEAYFALTSNTVQFGARAELYASAHGFSINGDVGFDVLIQFDPFFFLAEFHAQIQLKRGSTNLFKVKVEGALTGPRPLHVKAKATFEILWWDVSVSFSKTLVEGEKPPGPEPVNVLPQLKEALGNPGNWVEQLPPRQRRLVTLRSRPKLANEVLLHPLGTLTVKQSIVPLNTDISKFGQTTPAGARRFTINSVSLGDQNQTAQPVSDFFAPAQFFELSDDEKLSRPSFEPMTAGISFGSDEIAFSANLDDLMEAEAIEFETIIVDKQKNEPGSRDPKNLYQLSPALLSKQSRFGAAGSSELRRTGKERYRTATVKYTLAKEGWSIITTADLKVQPIRGVDAGKPATYSEAVKELQTVKQENPTKASGLKIVRLSELV